MGGWAVGLGDDENRVEWLGLGGGDVTRGCRGGGDAGGGGSG